MPGSSSPPRLLRFLLWTCVALAAGAAPARAADVHLAWDANTEPDLAGYVVLVGTASRVYTQSLEVGAAATSTTVAGLPDGTTFYFALRAVNASGQQSAWSNEVVVAAAGSPPPGGTPGGFVRHFAEGVQGTFFATTFALANPHPHPVAVQVALTDTFGQETAVPVHLPAGSRVTLDRSNLPVLASEAFGSRFTASHPVAIDRTVTWDTSAPYGAHSETGIDAPRTSWYLAEGATHSGFNLFYLLQNATNQPAEVRVRYLLGGGGVIEKTHLVGPRARTNIWVNKEDDRLASAEMSAHLQSVNGVPIVVERSMYLDAGGQLFTAGHNSAALPAPALRWFLAEGATGDYFDTFILIANPHDAAADLRVTYLLAGDAPVVRQHVVPPNSRYTIWVDADDERLVRADVSTIVEVTNATPVIVERAMWWPATPGGAWTEAHNSAASTTTSARWVLADGAAAADVSTYVLIANTHETPTAVRVTLLTPGGPGRSLETTIGAQQRFSIDAGAAFPEVVGSVFGVLVESLDGAPLVVERATYRDAAGIRWAAGTNSLATPLP